MKHHRRYGQLVVIGDAKSISTDEVAELTRQEDVVSLWLSEKHKRKGIYVHMCAVPFFVLLLQLDLL